MKTSTQHLNHVVSALTMIASAASISLPATRAQAALFSSASVSSMDEMHPYIAPNGCAAGVNLPADTNQIFFSKNCQYAFVPPRSRAPMTISSFSPSANIMQCKAVMTHQDSIVQLESAVNAAAKNLNSLARSAASTDALAQARERLSILQSALQDLRNSYSNIEAARVQVEFDGSQSTDQLKEARELNHQLIEMTKLIFVRAPITEGYLSINLTNVSAEQQKAEPAVLSSTVPGLRSPNQPENTVLMNGALSGTMTLSLAGACGLLHDTNYRTPLGAVIDNSRVEGLMAAAYTYAIPIQSGVDFKASVNVDNAIRAITNQRKISGQFSIDDLLRVNIQGSSSEICHLDVRRYEIPPANEANVNAFVNQLTNQTCGDLIARMLSRLVSNKMLAAVDRAAATDAAPQSGGNTATTAYRRECYDDSFAGISYNSGCNDVPYQILTWNDGLSEKEIYVDDQSRAQESMIVHLDTPLQSWLTTEFHPQTVSN